MKALSGKEFARMLESNGWTLQGINGSHHIYAKAGSPVRISVPIHGNDSLKVGLQRHLMKLSPDSCSRTLDGRTEASSP